MKKFNGVIRLLLLVFYISTFQASAQELIEIKPHNATEDAKNSVYIEFLGSSKVPFAIYYERGVSHFNNGIFLLAGGISILDIENRTDRTTLIGMGLFNTNRTGNWHLEFGAGLVYKLDHSTNQHDRKRSYTHRYDIPLRAGFKYAKPNGGLVAKLALTPNISLYSFEGLEGLETLVTILGLSVGYAF